MVVDTETAGLHPLFTLRLDGGIYRMNILPNCSCGTTLENLKGSCFPAATNKLFRLMLSIQEPTSDDGLHHYY